MSYYEYRVVPAPKEAPKARGLKGIAARYAHGMAERLNSEGLDGWEFQRSETMTAESRQGIFRRTVAEPVTVLIFRRWVELAELPSAAATAPETPEELGAKIAHSDRNSAARDVAEPASHHAATLSAQRRPQGALRPVPGPARD